MGTLISLTGPSASGKSTIEREMEALGVERLISFTTRPKREGEVNHVDYHFITRPKAVELIWKQKTLQHVEFNGHLYGTLLYDVAHLEAPEAKAVVVVEPQGVMNIRSAITLHGLNIDFVSCWITADRETLITRLVTRYLDDLDMTKEGFKSRMNSLLKDELVNWPKATKYDHHLRNEGGGMPGHIAKNLLTFGYQPPIKNGPLSEPQVNATER